MSKIEVFLASFPRVNNTELYLESRAHIYCAPEFAQRTAGLLKSDRIWEESSAELLHLLETSLKRSLHEVEFFDLGTWRGRLKGISRKIFNAPAMVIEGRKYVSLDACHQALLDL